MEQRLSLVTLAVEDLGAARRFYERGLGWKVHFTDESDVAFYQLNGVVFGLWSRASMAKEVGRSERELGAGGVMLAYNARSREDTDAAIAKAEAAGGRVVCAAHETEWGGYSGTFADPEGHLWEVAWNPAWTILPDGDIRL